MPRNSDTVKATNLRRAKSKKAKVVEWESRVYSRGIRDVPVEVSAMASQPKPKKRSGRRPRAESNDVPQGENTPQSMDIDETLWDEEQVMPASEKKVRQLACHSSTNLTHCSPRTPTLKNLFPRWALTCAASSILRAFRLRLHARAATLLSSSGGAPTASLHLYSARSAAESHTSCFPFTEFKNGWENTSLHRGCGRLGCACNLGTLGIRAQIKLCAMKLFIYIQFKDAATTTDGS